MSSSPEEIRIRKAQVRRELLARRNALPVPERMRLGERIVHHLLALPQHHSASTVLLYLTFRSEVPTEPLVVALAEAGKRMAVPHMTSGLRALVAAEYVPGDPLELGPYGVPQPVLLRPLPASALDLVIAPGAAFDRAGVRMGYGKGYYDRFLSDPELRGDVLGLAYAFQVLDRLPAEPHDRPMDLLATEDGIYDCGGSRPSSLKPNRD